MTKHFCDECGRELQENCVEIFHLQFRRRIVDEWENYSFELCVECGGEIAKKVDCFMKGLL